MRLITRLFELTNQSYFLFGPRGTGKTTFIDQIYPKALKIDCLDPEIERTFSARPERLYEFVEKTLKIQAIVIDEVQKIPNVLSVVHSIIEKRKDLQFILTGLSSRKLKREGVVSMIQRLGPFDALS